MAFCLLSRFLSRQSNQYTCLPNPLHKPVLSPEILVLSSIIGPKGEHALADVRVIGEIAQPGPRMYMSGLLKLSRLAQAVFARQPTRLFLHGFYICGLVLELWVFDRSGLYNCEGCDILKTPSRFLTVMAGYTLMSDAELAISTII
jgi:Fungal protein kinase